MANSEIPSIYKFLNDTIVKGELSDHPHISGIRLDHFKQGGGDYNEIYGVSNGKAIVIFNAMDVKKINLGRVHMYNEVQGKATIYAPTKQLGIEVAELIKDELDVYGFNFSETSQELSYKDGKPTNVEVTQFEFSTPKFNAVAKYNKQ